MYQPLTPLAVATFLWLAACTSRTAGPPGRTPADGLKSIVIDPAWKIELYAAEPMIADPVAMEIDEEGRVYVVQNSGYPLDTEHKLGKIWLLEDTTGDGKPDKSTLFAAGLTLPTGVMRWKKGILVTDAPNVWYMEDSNGDGKADIRKPLLTGFAFSNPQHTVNSPVFGLDNWIYLAHEGFANAVVYAEKFGDRGSDIRFADTKDGPSVKNERRNVRFRPDSLRIETTSSTSQFGIAFDDYGHLLTSNNSNHARQEVIAARYLARNPDLMTGSSMQDVSDHGTAAQVFSIVKDPRFELLSGTGVFTSACGITWWQGGTLIAEPVHGIVHRDTWKESGATFKASRARPNVEFLASTDAWFRPVNFYHGPDGALYVVDYYRKVIEHPEWTSRETAEAKDIYDGQTLGRIYRITPKDAALPFVAGLRLGKASDEQLVRYLDSPKPWWRRTAQRLLMDRRSDGAVGPLVQLAQSGASPLGRLHALWTLEGFGKLAPNLIVGALNDADAGVRENAAILAEPKLASDPKLAAAVLKLEADAVPRVRFQALLTLGSLATPEAAAARKRMLDRDLEDRWFQVAALSASSNDALPALQSALASRPAETPGRKSYLEQLGSILGARGKSDELARVLTLTAKGEAWWRASILNGLASGLRARQSKLEPRDQLFALLGDAAPSVRSAALRLIEIAGLPPGREGLLKQAASLVSDRKQSAESRADAAGLLALKPASQPASFYEKLIDPTEPESVQSAAVRALGKLPGLDGSRFLLARWRSLTPAVRNEAVDALTAANASGRFPLLLDAIDKGEVQPWSLPLGQRIRMQMNRDPQLRERARALLAAKAGNREEVVKRYQAALTVNADAVRGKVVFKDVCSKCHKMDGMGAEVGPDLATIRNRTAASLLEDILVPSRSIAQMYESYVVDTNSRGTLDGVIGQQTSTTITLVHEQGKQDVVPRSDIKQMYVSNLSAMPEDLDKEVSVAQMADLLAYLKKPD